MAEKIKVIVVEVDKEPERREIDNTLEAFQGIVGGYIEAVTLMTDLAIVCNTGLAMVCNEEGKLKGMPFNFMLLGEDIVGTVVFVGTGGEEFTDVPECVKLKRCGDQLLMRFGS